MIRDAYAQAAGFFVEMAAQVGKTQWEAPGLGVWSIRDLVGHTSRALSTVESYLAHPAAEITLQRPVDYLWRALGSLADPAAVAARGREAGAALGTDPAQAVRDIASRVLTRVQNIPDTAPVGTPVGGMRLIDYLPSRVFELTIHTLDLATALALAVSPPETAASVALHLLADMALQPGKAAPLLLAATGRRPLPAGYTVF